MGEPASVLIIIGSGAIILVAVGAVAGRGGIVVRPSTRAGAVLLVVFGTLLLTTGVVLAFRTSAGQPATAAPVSRSAPAPPPAPTEATSAPPAAPAPPAGSPATNLAPDPARPCSSQQAAPVRDGGVEGMAADEGYDFDCDARKAPADVPGLDISARHDEPVIDSPAGSAGAALARLPGSGPQDRAACDALSGSAWTKEATGIDTPGTAICVRTSEGNIAVMTITKGWTPKHRELSFGYRIWYG